MNMRELLVQLGFTPYQASFTDQQPGYLYDFGNFQLQTVQVLGSSFRPVMLFSGVLATPRTVREIRFEVSLDIDSAELLVAMIAYGLGDNFEPEIHPAWLDTGRRNRHLLPWVRRQQEYELRPKCHIDADWYRIAAKKLIAIGQASDSADAVKLTLKNQVLRFEAGKQLVAIPVPDADWPATYALSAIGLLNLSKGAGPRGVGMVVYDDHLRVGGREIPLAKIPSLAATNESEAEDRERAKS